MTVRAYVRVSTGRQAENGHGLAAQRAAIKAEAERRGWRSVMYYADEGWSGRDMARPAMTKMLSEVKRRDVVIVARLDRLSRSLVDFAALMLRAQSERWTLIALDLGVDLSSPSGEFMASVLAAMSRWEQRVISQRTVEGMAAAKGVLPGRRSRLDQGTRQRLVMLRDHGLSYRRIADRLNEEGVRTVSGREWTASTVHAAQRSIGLETAAEQARDSIRV
jgi:DNA invertase Pin-like site-specific DNA recombinase